MFKKAAWIFLMVLVVGTIVVVGSAILVMLAPVLAVGLVVIPIAIFEERHAKRLKKMGWSNYGPNPTGGYRTKTKFRDGGDEDDNE